MRRVVELIKEVVDRDPDPEVARARPHPIDRVWAKATKTLYRTFLASLGFILHSTDIFGPSSIYLPKKLIRTSDGIGTIPDGFTIDIEEKRWFIIEAELEHHFVWSHIAPQIAKQATAITETESVEKLIKIATDKIKGSERLKEIFRDEGIQKIDISETLRKIFSNEPIIGIPINRVSRDLENLAEILKFDVRLWLVRKYREFEDPENIMYEIPEEYQPAFDSTEDSEETTTGMKTYDVNVNDLIEAGYIDEGETLYMSYNPRGGEQHEYEGYVEEDGSITVEGETFSSPSYASLYCIQDAGSDRETDNGWRSWENSAGKTLNEIRDEYLEANN